MRSLRSLAFVGCLGLLALGCGPAVGVAAERDVVIGLHDSGLRAEVPQQVERATTSPREPRATREHHHGTERVRHFGR